MKKPLPIAIAHGYAIYRHSLKLLVETSGNYEVTIEAQNGDDLLTKIKTSKQTPCMCIIDLSTITQKVYSSLLALKEKWPDVKVIVISVYDNEILITKVLRAGAASFLYKNCSGMILAEAIAQVLEKGNYMTDTVSKLIMKADKKGNEITDKELHFLCLCPKDLGYKEMAQIMGVRERTVHNYRDSLFEKLELHSRSGLANFAIESGLMHLMEVH